ncbi:DUF2971 domain-containing protein [Pseudomonas japonica]|nr:DUF2971 domain-containing protein [Pseudomonas japonica]
MEFYRELLEETLEEEPTIKSINYEASPPSIDIVKILREGASKPDEAISEITNILFTKHIDWKYESEIRLGVFSSGLRSFDFKAIHRVVIGEKMPEGEKLMLRETIRKNAPHVDIRTARASRTAYTIDTV